jgi:hypothetical protein
MSRLRTRLTALLSVWAAALVAEAALYYFFLSRPYFRRFFSPFAVAVAIAAVAATWRIARPRGEHDRRHGDRRHEHRRAGE